MKTLPLNNDLVFDIIYGLNTSQINNIKTLEFKFYTDGEHYVTLTKDDIVDGQLLIFWDKINVLNDGILKYEYHINFDNENFEDGAYDYTGTEITDLYLKTNEL